MIRLVKFVCAVSISICMAGCSVSDAGVDAKSASQIASTEPTALERRPNIVVILTDDQGYSDVGFNGSTDIPTPNIDRIANEGVRFERGYVTFPVCGPSRAGLLTGRYQSRFGFDLNPSENPLDPDAGLPLSQRTIADVLKPAGYTSAILGKWHMGNHPSFHPFERGFDEFFGFQNGGHHFFTEKLRDIPLEEAKNGNDLYWSLLMDGRESVRSKGYLTDLLSDRAVDFVERNADQPFFLYLAYNAPHVPLEATQKYLDRFPHITDPKRKTYAAMISAVDDGVGDLLNKLDELNLADDTIVFFLSDNGGPLVRAVNGSINLPLRGGKGDVFEGGVRVPFAMRWTGIIPAGVDYPHAVSSLDILGTAAGVNGIIPPASNALDGVNLIPYLAGNKRGQMPHQQLFWRYPNGKQGGNGRVAAINGPNKWVRLQKNQMLFDVVTDKGEKNDLISTDRAQAEALESDFDKWNSEMTKKSSISIFSEWNGS